MRTTVFSMLIPLAAVLLLGCGEEKPPMAVLPPVAKGPAKTAAADTAAQTTASVMYMYSPVGKRDPFRGLYMEGSQAARTESGDAPPVCSEPLCNFDLNDLTVVAVVSGDANPLAMVEDKTGTGHMVRRNTKIGRQGGKVTQILRDCIVVTSFVSGPDGKAQPNKDSMCVKADSKSAPVLDLLGGKNFQ